MKRNCLTVLTVAAFVVLPTSAFASQASTDIGKFSGTNCPNLNADSPFVEEILKSGRALDKQSRNFNGQAWHITIVTSASPGDTLLKGEHLPSYLRMKITEKDRKCSYVNIIDSKDAGAAGRSLSFTLTPAEVHAKDEMDKARLVALEVDMKKELRSLRAKYQELPIQSFASAVKRLK